MVEFGADDLLFSHKNAADTSDAGIATAFVAQNYANRFIVRKTVTLKASTKPVAGGMAVTVGSDAPDSINFVGETIVVRATTRDDATGDLEEICDYIDRHDVPGRSFDAGRPNEVWVSDITYLSSRSGWLYLVVFIDLFSRRVVGWCVSTSLAHETVLTALSRAVWQRRPQPDLMIHSDRGIQYCCDGFRKAVGAHQFVQSMSRKADCWDNAVSESFFKTLKTEWLYHVDLTDLDHAERELFEYIEMFYNNQSAARLPGLCVPGPFERLSLQKAA